MPGKKDRKDRKRDRDGGGKGGGLSGLGLFGVPEMPTATDDDLEAELLALTGGGKGSKKGTKKPKSGGGEMSLADIDKMVASVKDIGEDDDGGDDDDGDLSDMDEDDLLAELQDLQEEVDEDEEDDEPPAAITKSAPTKPAPSKPVKQDKPPPVTTPSTGDLHTVQSRLQMYETAIATAKSKGESSKVRRYERGLKTLKDMSRSLKAGRKINADEIPPELSISGGGGGVAPPKAPPTSKPSAEDDDGMDELKSWISSGDNQPQVEAPQKQSTATPTKSSATPTKSSATPTKPSGDVAAIQDRLQMYQEVLKAAETQGDSSKVRRYKRAIDTIKDMLKTAKGGRPVNMEELPPAVNVVKPVSEAPPTQPPPPTKPSQTRPGNLIDLDAPEFDEFNLSEEDMAALMGSFVDDRGKTDPTPPPKATPTPPKLAPKPRAPPTSSSARPPGLIDLDTPEFAEFDLSDADIEMLAGELVDDRKKDNTPKPNPSAVPLPMPERPTQSLPSKPEPPKEQQLTKELVLQVLSERKEQYMAASQKAKTKGDEKTRKQYGLVAVNFKRAINSVESGTPVDLKGIPPPPPGFTPKYNIDISSYSSTPASKPHPPTSSASPQSSVSAQQPPTQEEEEAAVDSSIPTPKTAMEALNQRLEKYKEGLKSAQDKGESSRVRRTGRIIKQYEDAIKMTKAGKTVDYSELPTPPGFPPIPTQGGGARSSLGPPKVGGGAGVGPRPQPSPSQSLPAKVPMKLNQSVSDKQLQAIQERGAEFMTATKQAKAKGDKEKALLYLKYYKSIQQMLQAAQGGLPVDLSQLPPSPFSDPSKATATKSVLSHLGPAKEGDDKTFDLIENQLEQQIEVCKANWELYQKLGDLAASAQHKNMFEQCQRDLLAIKGIRSQDLAPPKFRMEARQFTIVNSHPEISDKVITVEIVRGITIPSPSGYSESDMNLYIEIEFPWPQDSPQKFQTKSVKESSNPEFNETCSFDIDRKQARSLSRIFKRHPIKFNIYQHRTLRKDIFIGLVSVPLESLETKCDAHVTEDLKDEKGRKPVGGKLEVIVRLREPLSGRDQEVKDQKWLVFEESIATEPTVKMIQPRGGGATNPAGVTSPIKVEQTTSLEALKLELSIIQNAVKAGKKDSATIQRGQAIQGRIKLIKQKLQDPGFKREYMMTIAREMKTEKVFEQQLMQAGRTGEAKVIQGRRRMMENELSKLQK